MCVEEFDAKLSRDVAIQVLLPTVANARIGWLASAERHRSWPRSITSTSPTSMVWRMRTASVRDLRGCHTQGRTVDEARRRIVEAMGLFVDDAESSTIVDDVKLPTSAAKAIRDYADCRKRADQEDRRAGQAASSGTPLARARNNNARKGLGRATVIAAHSQRPQRWSAASPREVTYQRSRGSDGLL